MTKAEIITRIIDRITDPWAETPEDYIYAKPIDTDTAKDIISECREEDRYLDPEDRLPEEATPELFMEAHNCYIRYQKYKLRVQRLAKYITGNEMVCEYDNFYRSKHPEALEVIPIDFLNSPCFPFATNKTDSPDVVDTFYIGLNSASFFNRNHEFCWFDRNNEILHSTNTPFADKVLDADAFARFVLSDPEALDYFVNYLMDEDDIQHIFCCSSADLKKEMNI